MNILKTSTREEILAQLKHISKYIEQSKATNLSKWPASEQVEYLDQIIDQIENQIIEILFREVVSTREYLKKEVMKIKQKKKRGGD